MFQLKPKRPVMEKMANAPKMVRVDLEGGQSVDLELHEPPMMEFLEFMETSIAQLSSGYMKNMAMFDKVARKGEIGLVDFQIFKPAFEPICNFIAVCARRPDLKGKIHKGIKTAQFVECVNVLLYLIDIERLYENFYQALERMASAKANSKGKTKR
jgi:hypothetical protein